MMGKKTAAYSQDFLTVSADEWHEIRQAIEALFRNNGRRFL
jgi:hypothetical protein